MIRSARRRFECQGWVALAAALLLTAKSVATESPLGALTEVARIFDYPVKKLVAKDLTENFRIKYGDDIVSAYEYSSRDNTFVPITVTVARQGILLTPELRVRLKRTLQAGSVGESGLPPMLRPITLAHRIDGFAGIEGFGSGQERWHLVLTLPQKCLDVHMSAAAAPSEMLLDVEVGTARYHEYACAGGTRWWDKLTEVGQQGVEHLSREPSIAATRAVATDREAGASGRVDPRLWGDSTGTSSLQAVRTAVEGGSSRWLLMGTCAWLIIGVLAARVGIYSK